MLLFLRVRGCLAHVLCTVVTASNRLWSVWSARDHCSISLLQLISLQRLLFREGAARD